MSVNYGLQTNVAINDARNLVFFPNNLVYNYKTDQWSVASAYSGLGIYSITDKNASIGVNRFSGNSVDLQSQNSTDGTAQTSTLETGSLDVNQGGRSVITGVRPLVNGGTSTVRVGAQDNLDDSVTYSASTSVTARTGKADFRDEGRYHRVELTVSGDFDTIQGADIEYSPQGQV